MEQIKRKRKENNEEVKIVYTNLPLEKKYIEKEEIEEKKRR